MASATRSSSGVMILSVQTGNGAGTEAVARLITRRVFERVKHVSAGKHGGVSIARMGGSVSEGTQRQPGVRSSRGRVGG